MKSKIFYSLILLFCYLLATLQGHAAHAAADIQPTSFLDNIDPVPARGEVTYSVVVKSNDQANPVTNAVLEIPLPAGFTFVSVSDAGCSYSGSTPSVGGSDKISCGWATITSQKNVDFHVLAPDTTGIYTLTATTSADVDSNPGNNSEIVTTQVVTSADLQLTSKTGTPNPVPGGGIVTYTFTVTNNGPYLASALTLTDVLPPGLTFVADNADPTADQDSAWSCSAAGQTVTCTAASLANAATSIFHLRVRATSATTGDITNAASVSATTADPEPDNNTATHDLTIIDGTDMAIAKSVATSPVIGGQTVQFNLTAANNGPMTAANVKVVDTLPTGYTSVSMITPLPSGWTCGVDDINYPVDPPVVVCTASAGITAGTIANFVIEATPPVVTDSVTHQNSAQVSTDTTDPISSNDNVTVNYTVNPDIADLSITKSKGPNPVAQGSNITSTIVVHNNGPRPADPVEVVDALSSGETYVSFSGTNWSCSHDGTNPGGNVTCTYSAVPLANGADTSALTITTNATDAGTLTNTACTGGSGGSAIPGYGDSNTGNNCTGAGVTSTTNRADLSVVKTTSDADLAPGENSFTYTVTVHNHGPHTAEAVDFRDTIPQWVTAGTGSRPATGLTATPSHGSCTVTNALVQCNLGDLTNGTTVTVDITVTRPMQDGTLTNTASAYSTLTGDHNRDNNEDSVDVTVQPVTDIEVTDKSVTYSETPNPILAGTIATYTIQVRNNGPSTAETVALADVFSGEAFDFIDASVAGGGSCLYDSGSTTLNCTLNDMAASTTKAITVRIRPDHNVTPVGDWEIDNTATVTMATTDSNPANNSQTENLPIELGVADLAITKNESASFTEPVRYNPIGTNLIVYKIDIANSGPSLATGVTFTDKVSSVTPDTGQELTFVRDTANSDGSAGGAPICDTIGSTFTVGGAAPTITCDLANDAATNGGQLASGASYTRYLVFQVLDAPDAVSGDSYHDEATVDAHETEPTPENNTENENTTVRTIADLELVKTASKSPVEVEESFSYTLTVTNHGPGKSPETTVTDTLPSGMVLTGAPVPSTGTCTGIAGNTSFTCALGLMDNGASATITVPVKVTTWSTPKHNCASVNSLAPEPDPDTTNLNTGCVDVVVSKPATLGNFVWLDRNANGIQNGEPAISGVTVRLLDSSFNVAATTTTNGSGIYGFTINHADTYYVEFVKPTGYFPSPKDVVVGATEATDSDADTASGRTDAIAVAYGDAITTVDAGFYQQVSLGNRVWHDSDADGVQDAAELGIPGVTVELLDSSLAVIATTTTDASGLYNFTGLTPGDYSVQITPPAWVGYLSSPVQTADPDSNSNTDSNIASTPVAGTFRSGVITLSSGQEPTNDGDSSNNTNLSLDLGLVLPGSIGNRIWLDEDSNGKQDAGEPGLANVTVELRNSTGTLIATTATDAHGGYLFSGIAPGSYFVKVLATSLASELSQTTTYSLTGTDFGNQNQSTSHGYPVALTSGGENLTADFGYNWSPTPDVTGGTNTGAIGDRVWIDHDGDGIQDAGEIGVSGVAVTLYSPGPDGLFWTADDVTAATTVTDASGNYIFDNLAAGPYAVEITASGAASHNILDAGNYSATGDPDHFAANLTTAPADTAGDHRSTRPIILGPGDTFINADFGYQPTGSTLHSIGDTVWLDLNRDGILDIPTEPGIQGVVVGLKNATGKFIATTTTDVNGQYLFTDLPDGNYTVVVIDSENVLAGLAQTYDADTPTSLDGQSALILSGTDLLDLDFGYTPISAEADTGAIGDTVFLDRNGNNTFDSGEGMEGVRVFLKNGVGTVIAAAFTDENGHYYFGGLAAATYTVEVDTTTLPAGITNSVDPNGDNNSTSTLILGAGAINLLQDFGYVAAAPGSIGNLVWKDINADGIYDADGPDNSTGTADDETGLAGVGMSLFRDLNNNNLLDANEPLVATTTTDSNGGYLFDGLPAGEYIVKVSDPANRLEGFWHSLGNTGLNNNSQADYYPVSLSAGDAYLSADFGYYHQPGSVGNRVWKDVNVNGVFDSGDTGLEAITVFLDITYPNGTTVTVQTTTDSDGYYTFSNLLLDENHNGISASTYGSGGDEPLHTVRIDNTSVPAGLSSIYPTRVRNTDSLIVGGTSADDEAADNGGDSPAGEPGYPPMGGSDVTNDFGYFEPGSIGDTVWNDANNNGLMDLGDLGLAGVTVSLTPPAGVNLGAGVGVAVTTTTDASGNYLFADLPPGSYTVTVDESTLPAVLQGHNTVDPNGGNDSTSTLTLAVNEDNLNQDFGYFVSCAIGNFVWDDTNANGIQESGETGHQGISVHLLDGSGNPVDNPAHPGTPYVLLTGSNGEYLFTGLIPGSYQVQFVLPTNNSFTFPNSGGDDGVDSDPYSSGLVSVSLGASESNITIDAGLIGAGIHLEKATNGSDADAAPGPTLQIGDTVNWTYEVSNTGTDTLSDVAVTDNKGVAVTCPKTTLATGEAMTCTGSGTAVAGQYENIGTAIGTPPSGPAVVDTDPSHYLAGSATAAAIDIEKFTNNEDADTAPGPVIPVGTLVSWTYVVTNIGNEPLMDITVSDNKGVTITCPGVVLSIGASMTCTGSGTAVAGQYVNIGSVTGTPAIGDPVTDADPSHYFGSDAGDNYAALDLEKATNGEDADAAPGPYIETGHAVTWSYVVTNAGNVDLHNVTVTDDQLAPSAIHCPNDGNFDNRITLLTAGAHATCTATGTAVAGQYSNTGSAIGSPVEGPNVSDTDPSHYYGDAGAIDIEKATNGHDADTAPGPKISTNRDVTWSYVVTNTGHLPLSQVRVTDDKEGAITCPQTTLDVAASMTCTATGKATKGQYENTGSVTAKTPDGKDVQDSDPSHYFGSSAWVLFVPPTIPHCPPTPDYCYMIADGDNETSTNSPLFKYIFKTNSLELVNRLGVNDVEASTLSLDGQILYSADNGTFGRIDLTPGKANSFIPIGKIGKGRGALGVITMLDVDGLSFDPTTSILYATIRRGEGADNQLDLLIQINPATGRIVSNAFGAEVDYVVIATSPTWHNDIDDISIDRNGVLYAVAGNSGGGGYDNLIIINKQTGAVQTYRALHSQGQPIQDMEGMTFYNSNTLYGTTGYEFPDLGTSNTLYQINKDTGEATPVSKTGKSFEGYIPHDFEAVSCFPVCR